MSIRTGVPAVILVLWLSACGGGGPSSSGTSRTTSGSSTTATATTATGASSTGASSIRATLIGQDHHPRAGKPWYYTLRVTDSQGRPLSGTVEVEFTFGTLVVGHDTPPVHRLKNGFLREELTFPARAIGHSVALQTVVHTKLGTKTLDWPVTTRP